MIVYVVYISEFIFFSLTYQKRRSVTTQSPQTAANLSSLHFDKCIF